MYTYIFVYTTYAHIPEVGACALTAACAAGSGTAFLRGRVGIMLFLIFCLSLVMKRSRSLRVLKLLMPHQRLSSRLFLSVWKYSVHTKSALCAACSFMNERRSRTSPSASAPLSSVLVHRFVPLSHGWLSRGIQCAANHVGERRRSGLGSTHALKAPVQSSVAAIISANRTRAIFVHPLLCSTNFAVTFEVKMGGIITCRHVSWTVPDVFLPRVSLLSRTSLDLEVPVDRLSTTLQTLIF